MRERKKIKLNMKFNQGVVVCAKSPDLCGDCNEECERMELFYYPFNKRDLKECFKNSYKRK